MIPSDLNEFIQLLRQHNQLVEIDAEVDANLEIAQIHRNVIAARGPALLFRNVRGKNFPVLTNMFGSEARVELAFGRQTIASVARVVEFMISMPMPWHEMWKYRDLLPRFLRLGRKSRPNLRSFMTSTDATIIPATTSWHSDGGAFLTLPLVHTRYAGKENLGIYRMQVYQGDELGMHFQIGKGGGYHLHLAEQQGCDLPANVYLGGAPALILSAIAPLPENVSEFLLCSFLLGQKLATSPNPVNGIEIPNTVEFCLSGVVPAGVRRPEGEFGDHYGYNSLTHDFPVFRPQTIYHRRDAIMPATVVGKPKQEDFYLGDYLQKLLLPIISVVMPNVRDLWSYGECGYHSLASCVLAVRYEREALSAAFRILGEGQLALTKFLFCIDKSIDLHDFPAVLTHVLARFNPRQDLYIFAHTAMDTLDYTGDTLNRGSKGVMLGIGEPMRSLPHEKPPSLLGSGKISAASMYCPGCLVLQSSVKGAEAIKEILALPSLQEFPLLVLVDDVQATLKTSGAFIWTVFTRFNPASDLHAADAVTVAHKTSYKLPLLIDARMKSSYPPELFCDPDTERRVANRWHEYFPSRKVEMGDSSSLTV